MRCPNGYRQQPPKSGNCVKNESVKVTRRKRCSGTRRSRVGDDCVPVTKKLESPVKYSPKIYDVASDITPSYNKNGYVKMKDKSQFHKKIQAFVNKNKDKYAPGDILFVGSTYETRQYLGFVIVLNKHKVSDPNKESLGADLPIFYKKDLPENLNYEALLKSLEDNEDNDLFIDFYGNDTDMIKNTRPEYLKNGLL